MRPPVDPAKNTRPTMSVARLRKKASKRPPDWQYGLLLGLAVLCFLLVVRVVMILGGGGAPSPVAIVPATATAYAQQPGVAPSQQPTGALPSQQPTVPALSQPPSIMVPALQATPSTVDISTVPTSIAGSSPTPFSTAGTAVDVAVATPAGTAVQAATDASIRRRPLAAAAKG